MGPEYLNQEYAIRKASVIPYRIYSVEEAQECAIRDEATMISCSFGECGIVQFCFLHSNGTFNSVSFKLSKLDQFERTSQYNLRDAPRIKDVCSYFPDTFALHLSESPKHFIETLIRGKCDGLTPEKLTRLIKQHLSLLSPTSQLH